MRKTCLVVGVLLSGCQIDDELLSTSSVEQHGMEMQGMEMQGMEMQGMEMQGMEMQGFQLGGATIGGVDLDNVRVEKGEVVAEQNGVTLRGTALNGAHFIAQAATNADPPVVGYVEYRITAVTPESSSYDPTHTGNTYLYTLEQNVDGTDNWQPACGADYDDNHVAIPTTGIWDAQGNRVESSTLFTFGCTTGVIAKCYRWGYRPWVTGYGDMVSTHWTCTRLARADYCGNGISNTHDGTTINVWDRLPAPGPIQKRGPLNLPPAGMMLEAGWNTGGAVCLSHARWLLDDTIGNLCPDRLVAPGLLGATVCDTLAQVLGYDPNAVILDDTYLHL
jgi:hypothetical protein